MYSIPRPADVAASALPCASWLPHHRRQQAILHSGGEVTMPCAVLAVGWGGKLVLLAVPLVGDHVAADSGSSGEWRALVSGAEAARPPAFLARRGCGLACLSHPPAEAARRSPPTGAVEAHQRAAPLAHWPRWPTDTRHTVHATAGGAGSSGGTEQAATPTRRSSFRGPSASRPASQLEALTPASIAQLTNQFSISILRMWDAGAALAAQGSEQLCVLGLHWYESETIGLVLQQGLHSLLVVLDSSNTLKEQLGIADAPVACDWLQGGQFCAGSLAGHGARMYLLGAAGLYCARLMHWQERLRTLQVGSTGWRAGAGLARGWGRAAAPLCSALVLCTPACPRPPP